MDSHLPPAMPPAPPVIEVSPDDSSRVWGFWATLGWGLLIAIAYVMVQSIAAGVFIALGGLPAGTNRHDIEAITTNGKLIALVTLASAPVVIGLCLGIVRLREGLPERDYLALKWASLRTVLRWLALFLVFLIVVDFGLSAIEGKKTQEFMKSVLATTGTMMPLLWLALVVAAPIAEEIFFRGFLFTGLQYSKLGGPGAVLVSGVTFACIHIQYDLQGLVFVLLVGFFLGLARLKTGSLFLCMTLHGVMNFISTVMQMFGGG
jgi:membrane protease YdiL (CAAX protease family)